MSSEPDPALVQKWRERPSCECDCGEAELNKVVGWCFHCSHVYVEYDPKIENLHFANHCPGVPEELKKSARERLVKH